MEGFISSAEFRIQAESDLAKGSSSSSSSAVFRKIEFHTARKPFNGLSNGAADFKIETLNPSSDTNRPGPGASLITMAGKKSGGSGFWESGLDPELSFGITFRKIGAGLENLGNTCFLNSVLQCLTYTEPLAAYLQRSKHQNSCHRAGFCALCAIQKHVSSALQATGRILAPKYLVSNLRCVSRNFRNCRQEDAHEYMINLLESMHKCCLPSGVPSESSDAYEKSLVHKIFGGRLRSQVKCTQCSHCSNKFDPFLDLSLDIMEADSLQKALSHFTAVELLDGGAKVYQCERCKQKVRAVKQLTVHKAPYVLTIHLKRFQAHESRKIVKKVQFGPTIDMKPVFSGSSEGDLKYTLYGVLVHYGGSIHSGHYACFVRTSSGMWYSLDDNRVVQVNERTVLGQQAYMLFYVRDRKYIVPKKSIEDIQNEKLKASVAIKKTSFIFPSTLKERVNGPTEGKLCSVDSPAMAKKDVDDVRGPKEALLNPSSLQTNGQMMGERSATKGEATVKSTTIAASSGKTSQPVSAFFNRNANIQSLENMPTSGAKTGNCIEEKNSMNKLEVPVNVSSHCDTPQISHAEKLASNETLQKINLLPDNGTPNVTKPVNPTDNTSNEVSGVASSGNSNKRIDTARPPNKSRCENTQVGTVPCSNLPNKDAVNNGQNVVHEAADMATPYDGVANELVKTTTLDRTSRVKSKKLRKCHIKNMNLGLKLFKLSLGLHKKKHKKIKRSPLEVKILTEEFSSQGSVTVVPSTSESTRTVSSGSTRLHGKINNLSTPNVRKCNGDSRMDATVGEFRGRIHQNGCVLASDPLKSSGMSAPGHQVNKEGDTSKESGKGPSEKKMMSILTRGLEETVVAKWDDVGSPFQIIESKSESISIGYVPDEWDEEYDRGKRKKIRSHKQNFGGPNPFQSLASKKFQPQKKAMVDRTSSANTSFRI